MWDKCQGWKKSRTGICRTKCRGRKMQDRKLWDRKMKDRGYYFGSVVNFFFTRCVWHATYYVRECDSPFSAGSGSRY